MSKFQKFAGKLLLLGLAGLMLGGCSSVKFTNLIGNPADDKTLNAIAIEGLYTADDATVAIKDLGEGKIAVGLLQWKEDKFEALQFEGEIRQIGNVAIVNLVQQDKQDGKTYYSIGRIAPSQQGDLVFYNPNIQGFEQAIADGELDGTVVQNDKVVTVTVTSTTEQLNTFLTPTRAATMFHVEQPTVLHRVSEKESGD